MEENKSGEDHNDYDLKRRAFYTVTGHIIRNTNPVQQLCR